MSGPAEMNYSTLLTDVTSYLERPEDSALQEQLPRLVMLAENRIATDLRILGTQKVVQGTFSVGASVLAKPAFWRKTVSFTVMDSDRRKRPVFPRTYEFCREYSGADGLPRYYADYNFDNILVTPPAGAAYDFELMYIARLEPLSESSQVNWYTTNAPQLLLAATLLEAEIWLKNDSRIPGRTEAYVTARTALAGEDGSRLTDRSIVVG